MSNLKDTDFDDLFRRASDKYPLRTDSSDWDRMAAALEKDPSPDAFDEVDNPDRRRRRRFFWWFLLLPLAGIGYFVVHPSGHGGQKPADQVTARPAGVAANANGAAADANGAPADANGAPAGANGATANANGTAASANDKPAHSVMVTKPSVAAGAAGGDGSVKGAAANGVTAPVLSEGPSLAHGMPRKGPGMVNSNHPKNSGKGIRSGDDSAPTAGRDGTTDRYADDQAATIDPKTNPVAAAFTLRNTNINQQRARIAGPYALNVAVKAKEIKKDSTKPKSKNQSYLYAGIVGAPDLSTVKFQTTKGVGTTFGVLIGYAFGPHWAIETGAYVDRKRYYTEGEYFSTKNVYLPPNSELLNVDGTCYMWEIPINVRYTFNPSGKTRWFATAGLSTYLMNRENYNYEYKYYNGSYTHSNAWDLRKASQYPFSIVGFSAGFEQRLGSVGNLRIEPYLRMPLGGIGTGSLPIMSTGINIGITRRLWK